MLKYIHIYYIVYNDFIETSILCSNTLNRIAIHSKFNRCLLNYGDITASYGNAFNAINRFMFSILGFDFLCISYIQHFQYILNIRIKMNNKFSFIERNTYKIFNTVLQVAKNQIML